MKHDPDIRPRAPVSDRSVMQAMLRGWRRRCPNCGGGPMMKDYLTVRRTCASCGEHLHHHKADDLPAYLVIAIVGKILITALISVEFAWSPPAWVYWSIWPAMTLALALLLLPRVKGVVVGMQWAMGMHGFGDDLAPEDRAPADSGTEPSDAGQGKGLAP